MTSVAETAALIDLNVRAIVTDKEAVRVTAVSGKGSQTTFFVEVGNHDRGKIIGKQGRTARSLRVILSAIAKANGHDYNLDLDDLPRQIDGNEARLSAPSGVAPVRH